MFGVIIGLLFLEETHAEKKHRFDPGLALGKRLLGRLSRTRSFLGTKNEKQPLLQARQTECDELNSVPKLNSENEPRRLSTTGRGATDGSGSPTNRAVSSKVFTIPVILNILSYGILALYDSQLFPFASRALRDNVLTTN